MLVMLEFDEIGNKKEAQLIAKPLLHKLTMGRKLSVYAKKIFFLLS